MNTQMRLWLVLCLTLILLVTTPSAMQAQGCSMAVILNESSVVLNESQICEAATPWASKGHQVYVYVTDEDASSEEEWFAIRDRVEIDWGIYDRAADEFSKKAVAIELTTDSSKPWGQDLAFGEMLFGTALDNDSAIGGVEGQMKNAVAQENITGAIVNAFNNAYKLAYPPPPPTTKPVPTIIVTGPTTNVKVDFGPLARLLIWAAVLAALGAIVYFFGVPLWNQLAYRRRLAEQANLLHTRLAALLNACEGLLKGDVPENTLLFALWQANGGDKYEKRNVELHEYLRRCQVAVGKSFEAWLGIQRAPAPKTEEEHKARVKNLEMLYLTVVGNNQRILKMTQDEQMALLDPMLALAREETDVQLVQQVDDILRQQRGAGKLRVQFMIVKPEELDAEGILGYVEQVKVWLQELGEARAEAPGTLKKAVETRQSLSSEVQMPKIMAGQNAFAFPDTLIAQAQQAQENQLWLDVKQRAEEAIAALANIPQVLQVFVASLQVQASNLVAVEAITAQGYRTTEAIQQVLQEATQDVATIIESIVKGDYARATEFSRELQQDSARSLKMLQGLVALREASEKKLVQLARDVARVEKYRTETVQPDWQALQVYPKSNWQIVATNFDSATQALNLLFDDPANHEDVASEIARANSMEQQLFEEAERQLVDAFVQLNGAEDQLKAVVAQLGDIRKIEETVAKALEALTSDIKKARARRDQDNAKIDSEVDQMIDTSENHLTLAQKAVKDREFTLASQYVTQARQLASQAYASADEQADAINKLYAELAEIRKAAEARFAQASNDLVQLVEAARSRNAEALVSKAQELLQLARRAETAISGEDHDLADDLQQAVSAYQQTEQVATKTVSQIETDKRVYDGEINSTRDTLSSAQMAIATASRYVQDSDADGAGRHALSSAQSSLPSEPSYGETAESLARRRSAAQEAQQQAERASQEARSRIAAAEATREAERQRQAAEAARRAAEANQRAAEAARRNSYSSSSSMGSSSRRSSSSMSSSSPSRSSSSMGSSRRR